MEVLNSRSPTWRGRDIGHERIYYNYFSATLVYDDKVFCGAFYDENRVLFRDYAKGCGAQSLFGSD
jgi:hypothetical protein